MVLSNKVNMQTYLNNLLMQIKNMGTEERNVILTEISKSFTLESYKYVGRKSIERRKKRNPSQQTVYRISKNDYDGAKKNAQEAEKSLQKYELENYTIYVKAIDDYEQFLEAGKAGNGGILKDRERSERALRKATDDLKGAQYTYNAARTVENQIAVEEGSQAQYRSRKDRIWMDDRQEIQEKLKSQTQKYESKLSENDITRMQELKDIPDYKDVVDYMLKNKVKLEQEIVSLRLMSK